ncbi:hypothetical protein CANCADRAFT_105161 [Tortispora caseinolytica NRRL Y-17796]|uniref:Leucine carboxyl methyltransferase 1 n=1 Tax=Tortispora caseinolytica NRRL Y-17796 TaxID=767744 RepID=A0A1E4TF98_9ASCO|nr:hypothetical protein CANCADRAFT_105161 [Tortispora caseinolytica NRRL Y-17796]
MRRNLHRNRRTNVVMQTDLDALGARWSCVAAGYMQDPYIELLSAAQSLRVSRKLPVINRGTFLRTVAIDGLIETLAQREEHLQVVSLGAGSDTRPFRLLDKHAHLTYHEIDFKESVDVKSRVILSTKALRDVCGVSEDPEEDAQYAEIRGSRYSNHGLDLKVADGRLVGVKDVTTIILSECCLCYMTPDEASHVLKWVQTHFSDTTRRGIVMYEPLRGADKNDSFARVMFENLAIRGLSLLTVNEYPTTEAQISRLQAAIEGQSKGYGWSMLELEDMWNRNHPDRQLDDIERLDEREEWVLLAKHYGIFCACTDDERFDSWNLKT